MNISVTTLCNRTCKYCFAKSVNNTTGHISRALFRQALEHLCSSEIKQARILGGEPTIHPLFSVFLDMIEERNLELLLFSNGCMPEKAIQRLGKFPKDKLFILLNTPQPHSWTANEKKRFLRVCSQFGTSITLGYNIYSPVVDLNFLLPLIRQFALAPAIRLGLAHPCIGVNNTFLHPRHYRIAGQQIGDFARLAKKEGVRLELDCGFVPCMFSRDDLTLLHEASGSGGFSEIVGKRCNPLPDFLPDGRFIPCYPLAKVIDLKNIQNFPDNSIQDYFTGKLVAYRQAGIFSECSSCTLYKKEICNGGCLAAAMQRRRHISFTFDSRPAGQPLEVTEEKAKNSSDFHRASGEKRWIIPYIDQPVSFWRKIKDRFPTQVSEVYTPLPGGGIPTGRPLQKTEYLDDFLQHSPFSVSFLVNPIVLPKPVNRIAPSIIEQLRQLSNEVPLKSVTVADYTLAQQIKDKLPGISLTASVLMDIARPHQAVLLNDICDTLVPASRIVRDFQALKTLKQAFTGRIRLMVNESCLPDCVFRTQHFFEMGCCHNANPESLCQELLKKEPWMRLTGAWILPQHLHVFSDVADEFKLAGRVTIQNPKKYIQILHAYITGKELTPDSIGGGPASVLNPIFIKESFFRTTLGCGNLCHTCTYCRDYFARAESNEMYSIEHCSTAGHREQG